MTRTLEYLAVKTPVAYFSRGAEREPIFEIREGRGTVRYRTRFGWVSLGEAADVGYELVGVAVEASSDY